MAGIEKFAMKYDYIPLSLYSTEPLNVIDAKCELRRHCGLANEDYNEDQDVELAPDSLIYHGKIRFDDIISYIVDKDENFLDRVHVCIIADGYDKISKGFLKNAEKAGIFNAFETTDYLAIEIKPGNEKHDIKFLDLKFINTENMNKDRRVYGANNIAHCFSRHMMFHDWFNVLNEEQQNSFKINDYSVHDFMLGGTKPGKVRTRIYKHMPLPIHFVIKHKNQGKIESHKWFFKGFCEYMEPTYAQIIDCGSIPLWKSISHIIWHMETIPDVGGACGEIEVMLPDKKDDGTAISFIESILLRGQYVEYKLSHYMDKAAESLFGFVSVLPGAFSTFRWECIKGRPLNSFLKGSKDEYGDIEKIMACYNANKYLAEDRIMCLEIIAKEDCDYLLHYIPGAKCLTDPPLSLTALLKQRRRWFNGSLFASFHVLLNMCRIWKRKRRSFCRNLLYMILYFYMTLQMMLSLVLVGSFYGSFSIFLRAILPSDKCLSITRTANVLENFYLIFLFMVIIMSTTVSIDWAETGFRVCSVAMGLFTLLMVACSIAYAFQATLASISVIFISIYILSFVLPLLMNASHLKVCDFLKGVVYSIYLTPTYINIFTIYAISNIHDVTWGSRPSVINPAFVKTEEKKQIIYKNYRSNVLVVWLITNVIVGFLIVYISRSGQYIIMLIFGVFLMIVLSLKLVFAILHWIKAKNDRRQANALKKTKTSNVFNNLDSQITEENVFQVYHEIGEIRNVIKNHKDIESDKNYETSVESKDICMGFDVTKELAKHKIVQDELLRHSVQKFITQKKFPKIRSVKELYQIQEESKEEEKIANGSYEDSHNLTRQSLFPVKNVKSDYIFDENKKVKTENHKNGAKPNENKRELKELDSRSIEVNNNDIHIDIKNDLENSAHLKRHSKQPNKINDEEEVDLELEDDSDSN